MDHYPFSSIRNRTYIRLLQFLGEFLRNLFVGCPSVQTRGGVSKAGVV